MEDAAKGIASALLDQVPSSYLPVILISLMFIAIIAIIFALTNRHIEKMSAKSIEQIRMAYTDNMKTQNETIRILTKSLSQIRKNNL